MTERLWTRAALAEHLVVSMKYVDRLIAKGEIDSVLMGRQRRIPDSAVRDYLSRQLQPAKVNRRRPGRKPAGTTAERRKPAGSAA